MRKSIKILLGTGVLAAAVATGVAAQSAAVETAVKQSGVAKARLVQQSATPQPAATAAATRPTTRPALPAPQADVTRAQAIARAEALFTQMDANGDGRLTQEDRTALRERMSGERFSRLDTDSNGAISRTEWDRAGADMIQRRETRRGGAPEAQDGQRDGHPRLGMHRGGGRMMMQGADANNDGVVTREEFVAAAGQRFDRLDSDRNGTLTAAEKQADRGDRRGPGRRGHGHGMRDGGPPPAPVAPATSN